MTDRTKRRLAIGAAVITIGVTAVMVWHMVGMRHRALAMQDAADAWASYRTCLLDKDAAVEDPGPAIARRAHAATPPAPGWPRACDADLARMAGSLDEASAGEHFATLRAAVDHALHRADGDASPIEALWRAARTLPPARGAAPAEPPPAAP